RGAAEVARPRPAGNGQAHGRAQDPRPGHVVAFYPEPVARLIDAFQRLPGIGPKTAQRLTFFLLKRPAEEVRELSSALAAVKERIIYCTIRFNLTDPHPLGVRIRCTARCQPAGGSLSYADQVTLTKALEGRREIG